MHSDRGEPDSQPSGRARLSGPVDLARSTGRRLCRTCLWVASHLDGIARGRWRTGAEHDYEVEPSIITHRHPWVTNRMSIRFIVFFAFMIPGLVAGIVNRFAAF